MSSGEETKAGLSSELREGTTGQAILAALVAWIITVVPAAFARGSGWSSKIFCVLALGAAVSGPMLDRAKHRIGRHIGITAFVSLSVATWLTASSAIHPARLEPTRGAIGAIAWGVFAIAWSERWSKPDALPADPEAPALQARSTLPPLAVPVASLAVGVMLILISLAWRIRDADRALVAQTLAIGLSIWLLGAGSTVAIARGKRRAASPRRINSVALRRLVLLAVFAIAGAIFIALR